MTTFNVYGSDQELDPNNLPEPLVTGLTSKNWSDHTAVQDSVRHYMVGAVRDGVEKLSDPIQVLAGIDFDSYLQDLAPITWLKLDEIAAADFVDSGTLAQPCSVDNADNLTPRGMVLRKGHAGAMGFAIASQGVGRVTLVEAADMYNITKSSHSWLCYHYRTESNGQNRLFGDNGDGTNMRVFADNYQFPNNQHSTALSFPTGTIVFTAVVYDTVTGTYKKFQNGVWTSATYEAPPTDTSSGQTFQVPATNNAYAHYGVRGYISDLTFFNRALSNAEIEQIYALGQL